METRTNQIYNPMAKRWTWLSWTTSVVFAGSWTNRLVLSSLIPAAPAASKLEGPKGHQKASTFQGCSFN